MHVGVKPRMALGKTVLVHAILKPYNLYYCTCNQLCCSRHWYNMWKRAWRHSSYTATWAKKREAFQRKMASNIAIQLFCSFSGRLFQNGTQKQAYIKPVQFCPERCHTKCVAALVSSVHVTANIIVILKNDTSKKKKKY